MNKQEKETLKNFQCEYNRKREEDFASALSEREDVRVFFINENEAFTDGQNIIVDPAMDYLFIDTLAMKKTETFLKMPYSVSKDSYLALKMITRTQTIHETLHLIFSPFPTGVMTDVRATTKMRKTVLANISNIIEDAFIEAAGASEFDNMALYLLWGRVSRLYANTPSEGSLQRAFKDVGVGMDKPIHTKTKQLLELMNYFVLFLLYPMLKLDEPTEEIKEYVEKIKPFFYEGSICIDSIERYSYTSKIFDVIEPLICEEEENVDMFNELALKLLGGMKTHKGEKISITEFKSLGKKAKITRRLFRDLEGNLINWNDLDKEYERIVNTFQKEKGIVISIVEATHLTLEFKGKDFKSSAIHKNITIKVERPKPNLNLKKAYENICRRYQMNINTYNARLSQLLKGVIEYREDRFTFGNGISSNRIGDVKKRFWYRKVQGINVPDIAIAFLIDGSGSMKGLRCDSARISLVILHEVLAKNNIEHAIIEHRAIYNQPTVKHTILLDFNCKVNEKYNIVMLNAQEGTREGLSLYWAEKYLREQSCAKHKIIVVLADGTPEHHILGEVPYFPPLSIKDTANAATKIKKNGIDMIAIALDDFGEEVCYKALKKIYPHVIPCDDLKQLTGKLLMIVSKLIS